MTHDSRRRRLLDPARPLGLDPRWVAAAIWVGTFVVIGSLLVAGGVRTLSFDVYATAGQHWWARQPLYQLDSIERFQYFPQAALLFVPFSLLGFPAGDLAWRALGWAAFALAVWRLCRHLVPDPARAGACFLLATLLPLGVATGPLRNGQGNLHLAAAVMHLAVELGQRRWTRAAAVMAVGLALKPLMAVPLLLGWALHRRLWWRTPLALVALAALPWLFADPTYVAAQHLACLAKLSLAAAPPPSYENLRGMLAVAGLVLPHSLSLATATLAALAVLGCCVRIRRTIAEPYAALLVVAFAAAYLMLFNPRTQSTSYTLPAGIAAVMAALYLLGGRRGAALAMLAALALWSVSYHWLPLVELWLKPLAALLFAAWLVREIVSPPSAWRRVADGAPEGVSRGSNGSDGSRASPRVAGDRVS